MHKKILTVSLTIPLLITACDSGAKAFPTYTSDPSFTASPIKLSDIGVDQYLNQPDIQYVDLRSLDERESGYIFGFEFIPFWDFLWIDSSEVDTRKYLFTSNGRSNEYDDYTINNEFPVGQYFDKNAKAIMMMCYSSSSCGRSHTIKRMLDEHFNYKNTYNIGGIVDYKENNNKYLREIK